MSAPLPSPVVREFCGEARIILPYADNDGFPLERVADGLRAELIARFGGYTETEAFGGFVLVGITCAELVRVFDVACEHADWNELVRMASRLARLAKQDCIYLRLPAGLVLLVGGSAK